MRKKHNVVFQLAIVPTNTSGKVLVPVCKWECHNTQEMNTLEKKLIKDVKDIFKVYRQLYLKK